MGKARNEFDICGCGETIIWGEVHNEEGFSLVKINPKSERCYVPAKMSVYMFHDPPKKKLIPVQGAPEGTLKRKAVHMNQPFVLKGRDAIFYPFFEDHKCKKK